MNTNSRVPALFFVVFFPRSGSTLLADLLTRHPDVAVAPEADFLQRLVRSLDTRDLPISSPVQLSGLLDIMYTDPKFTTWDLPRAQLQNHLMGRLPMLTSDGVRLTTALACQRRYGGCGSRLYGYKKGGWYARNASLLKSFFPEARFIHIVRDGRAAYASARGAIGSLTGKPLADSPRAAAREWRNTVRAFESVRREEWALEIRYETLVTHPVETLRAVLDFLGVRSDEPLVRHLLEPHESAYVVQPQAHLHVNVGKEPNPSRIDAWQSQLAQDETEVFERIAGLELEQRGYRLMYAPKTSLVLLILKRRVDALRLRHLSALARSAIRVVTPPPHDRSARVRPRRIDGPK
jgi:hypothetical protein